MTSPSAQAALQALTDCLPKVGEPKAAGPSVIKAGAFGGHIAALAPLKGRPQFVGSCSKPDKKRCIWS